MDFNQKIAALVELVTTHTRERYTAQGYDWKTNEAHNINSEARSKPGKVYTRIDQGGSGRFMVENSTGEIYGIKAYGQVHKGHHYGNLDTINLYFWGEYTPRKKPEAL